MNKLLTRRTLAKLLAGAAAAPLILPRRSRASGIGMLRGIHPIQEIEPHRMSFGSVISPGYLDLAPAGLVDFTDTFSTTASFTLVPNTGGASPTFSVASNTGSLSITGGSGPGAIVETSSSLSVPNLWAQVDVTSFATSGVWIGIGLIKDGNNMLVCRAQPSGVGNSDVFLRVAGNNGTSFGFVNSTWTAPFSIGISLVTNGVTFFRNTGSGWTKFLGSFDVSGRHNFSTDGNLAGWKVGIIIGGSVVVGLQNFQSGRFGGGGIRDFLVVSNEDGTPYYPGGNNVYTTATVQGSYTGIFLCDTVNNTLTQTGAMYFDTGTVTAGYLPAQIIYYPNGDRRVIASTFGGGAGASVALHKLILAGSQPDILTTNSSIVTGATDLGLPLGSHGAICCYDFYAAYQASKSRWLMAYALSQHATTGPFWPALASSPSLDTPSWTLIGEDFSVAANPGWEGSRILRANHKFWPMFGSRSSGIRIYDDQLNFIGSPPGASTNGAPNTQPHPMIFPMPDNHQSMLLTNDGTEFDSLNSSWGQPKIQITPRFV